MSASDKDSLNADSGQGGTIKKLGILAGGGAMPAKLLKACDRQGIEVFIIAFKGQTDPAVLEGRRYLLTRLGAAGQVMETLKNHDISDLVMIGSIKRPSLPELKPDLRAARFFARIGLGALGDDGLLGALRGELEKEGFRIHGVHKFADDLLARKGALGTVHPHKADWSGIERGVCVSQAVGRLDIGQSVIIQEGLVLGVEAAEGTDELIRRCAAYKRKGRGAILVKTCKPEQDRDLDLPTIGPDTVMQCAEAGMAGIVVHAGHSLVLDSDETAAMANARGIFVIGVDVDDDHSAAQSAGDGHSDGDHG